MLIIANSQIDDSGIYVCQGQSGDDTVEERISIVIGGKYTLKLTKKTSLLIKSNTLQAFPKEFIDQMGNQLLIPISWP